MGGAGVMIWSHGNLFPSSFLQQSWSERASVMVIIIAESKSKEYQVTQWAGRLEWVVVRWPGGLLLHWVSWRLHVAISDHRTVSLTPTPKLGLLDHFRR